MSPSPCSFTTALDESSTLTVSLPVIFCSTLTYLLSSRVGNPFLTHPSSRPSQRHEQSTIYLFPTGAPPPICPNTDPRCNRMALCPSGLPAAISPLIREAWSSHLTDYLDCEFINTVMNIIDVGASIGHLGPQISQSCSNLRSALDHWSIISKEIESLHAEGRIHGPFREPPLPYFRCSPLGTSTCKRNPKCRVFNHYSWPKGHSINDETPDEEGSIAYDPFTSAAKALWESGKGSLMAKLDLKDAYRHIPVCCTDWNLMGLKWLGEFHYPVVLMFCGKSAPYIFNLFTEALHWIIERHIPAALHHYLDDFLPIFKPSMTVERANVAVTWIEALAEELGLSFQPEKTIWPTTCLEFLGLELDSSLMEARLPQEKLEFLQICLRNWQARSHCTLKE